MIEFSSDLEDAYHDLVESGEIPMHDYFLMVDQKSKREAAEAAISLANETGETVQVHRNGMSVTVFPGHHPGKIESMLTRSNE